MSQTEQFIIKRKVWEKYSGSEDGFGNSEEAKWEGLKES